MYRYLRALCVPACMYVCLRAYMCAGVHVCVPACMYVCLRAYMCACVYVCVPACMYVCLPECMCVMPRPALHALPSLPSLNQEEKEPRDQAAKVAARSQMRADKAQLRQQDVADVVDTLEGCLREKHPFVAAATAMKLTLKRVLVLLGNQENWTETEISQFELSPTEMKIILGELQGM
jgi:hypothetical protein